LALNRTAMALIGCLVLGLEELWGPNMRMLNIADDDFEASTGGH